VVRTQERGAGEEAAGEGEGCGVTGPLLVPASDAAGTVRDIAAWPTGVPGLVVARLPREARSCEGLWSVLHARSGSRAPYCLPDPEAALGLALALRDVTDWQQPGEAVREAMRAEAYQAVARAYRPWRCEHGYRPGAITQDNGVIA
jgi:hypothetical protein